MQDHHENFDGKTSTLASPAECMTREIFPPLSGQSDDVRVLTEIHNRFLYIEDMLEKLRMLAESTDEADELGFLIGAAIERCKFRAYVAEEDVSVVRTPNA